MTKYSGLEIAVIGMAARFPNAKNIAQYWQNIQDGRDCISDFSDEELLNVGESPDLLHNSSYVKSGGYLADKNYFDYSFFDYKPNEAELLDPQIRIFHECCWEALEDSGYSSFDYSGKIGLYGTGSSNLGWEIYSRIKNQKLMLDEYSVDLLSSINYLCSRVSYKLNLRGPSLFLHTACSSSLLAINKACTALLMGECSIALAGGVSLRNNSRRGYLYEEGMIYSKDGRCRPFDADASGTIGGEGSGVVILKKLKDAIDDKDHIYAVVKGSAINNDGNNKVGFTAPSIKGQRDAIIKAQRMAGVHPDTIGYIETHGTATNLGDPTEIEALNDAFKLNGSTLMSNQCAIGSVKGSIGHLDTTAGVASFIKTVLALKHSKIPPSVNFNVPNPKINFRAGPFYVSNKLQDWPVSMTPLRAGVSSFGIGGTNVHLILEQFAKENEEREERQGYFLLLISAKSPESLTNNIKSHFTFLSENDVNMGDVAYTLQVGRMHFNYRKMLICRNKEEALSKLSAPGFLYSDPLPKISGTPKVVFMFPGQGAQYEGMYKILYDGDSKFKAIVDQCFEIAKKYTNADLKGAWLGADRKSELNDINLTQHAHPLLFIFEYSLAKLLISFGILPDYMIGHGLGENVAACLSGVFTLDAGIKMVIARGQLTAKNALGAMLSVHIAMGELVEYLKEVDGVDITSINSELSMVVSGQGRQIEVLERKLNASGYLTERLSTCDGCHSPLTEDILNVSNPNFEFVTPTRPNIPFISNVTGNLATHEQVGQLEYWTEDIRKPINFHKGINRLLAFENTIFLELGPGTTLINFIRENGLLKKTHTLIDTVRSRNQVIEDTEHLQSRIGQLWLNGVQISWASFVDQEKRSRISLPTYAFTKSEFAADVDLEKILGFEAGKSLIPKKNGAFFQIPVEGTLETASSTDLPVEGALATDLEAKDVIQHLFKKIFGREGISPFSNFFEMGGDSITAIQLKNLIYNDLKVNVSISEIFEHPVPHDLSVLVKGRKQLSRNGTNMSLSPHKGESTYAASPAQKRIYFKQMLDKSSTVFNISVALETGRCVNVYELTQCLDKLIERHTSLRTSFHLKSGDLIQRIEPKWELSVENYTGKFNRVEDAFKSFVRPFDLLYGSLVRFGLMEENFCTILFIDVHHLICDGLSLNILIRDFCHIFLQRALPPESLSYIDYSIWQSEQSNLYAQRNFWKVQLSGSLPPLNFPKVNAQKLFSAHRASTETLRINGDLYQEAKKVSKINKTTDFMLLLAISHVLLSKLSGNEDIIIGTDSEGRSIPEFENIVGTFVNILPIRTRVDDEDSFETFLNQVKNQIIAAYRNQDIQFDEIIGLVDRKSLLTTNSIFDVHFSFSNTFTAETELNELKFRPLNLDIQVNTEYDLKIEIREAELYLDVVFIYNNEVYDQEFIKICSKYFKNIMVAVTSNNTVKIGELAL